MERTTATFGEPLVLSGRVRTSGPCAVEAVRISIREHGADSYRALARAPIGPDRAWTEEVLADVNASYTARPVAGDGCDPSSSVPVDVLVRALVTLDRIKRCDDDGATVRGKVLPRHPGTNVLLQRSGRSAWTTRDASVLDEDGRFGLRVDRCRGRWRVVWPGQSDSNERGEVEFTVARRGRRNR